MMKNKQQNHHRSSKERIEFLCSPKEKLLIEDAAARSSVSISHFVRHYAILQARFLIETDQTITPVQKTIPLTTKLGA
jgi:uncharacterized protein (DUF1778 family)